MPNRLIIDDRDGSLYSDFTCNKKTSLTDVFKSERGLAPTVEIFSVNVATDTRAVVRNQISSSNVSVLIGESAQIPDKGFIKAQWSVGGSLYESSEIDFENLSAKSLESAFNTAVYPVYIANGLEVDQIGLGKYLLTMKKVGAIDGTPSLLVESLDPPSAVEVTTIRSGDTDTRAQYLLSLAKLPVAKIATGSWASVTDGKTDANGFNFTGLSATISLNTTAMLAAVTRNQNNFEFSVIDGQDLLHRSQITIDETLDPTTSGAILLTTVPISNYLQTNGGTMSGAIAMGNNKITGLASGVASGDAATKGQLDALIDGSPDNLNTLNELAAALNDDQNFSTTVTNNIASKLPKDGSEAMTGALTVPSINVGDSHTLANDANDNLEIKSSTSEDLILNGYNVYLKNNHTNGILATFGAYNTTLSTPVRISTGSAASPALSFSSDTDTGIFYESDLVSFSINGTRKAYISTAGVTSEANVYHSATGSFRGYGYDAVISTNSGYGIVFKPNDQTFGKFTSSGNLGIGSDLEADKTLVVRSADAEIVIDDIDTTDTPRLRFRESGSTSGSVRTDASNLIFETGLNEAARFDSSGHFLIGDDKKIKLGDDADLEIYNAANSNSVIKKTSTGGLFLLNDSTTYIQGTFGEDMARFIKDGAVELFYNGSKTFESINGGCQITGNLGIGGTPLAQTYIESDNNSFTATGTPSNYHLVLRNPQNDLNEGVGIGFTSSTGTDSIGAAIAFERTGNQAQGDLVFSAKSSTSAGAALDELMRLDGSASSVKITGSLGIGGTPVVELDVQGDMMVTNTAPRFILKESGSAKDICFKVQTDGRLSIFDDNQANERMTVLQDGKVGIGTASTIPHLFSVKGTISRLNSSGIQVINLGTTGENGQLTVNDSSGTTRIALNSNGDANYINAGNFGIGTTSPSVSLHVKKDSSSLGPVLRLDNGSTSDLSQSGIQFVNGPTGVPRSAIYSQRVNSAYDAELVFYTSPDDTLKERLRIDHDGHIRQNFINYTDASNYEALKISAESDHIKFDAQSVGSFASNARDIRFAIKGTQRGQITEQGVWTYNNFYIAGTGSLRNYGNHLKLTTGGGDYDIQFIPNNTTQMTLKSDTGRLGIGTTSPGKTVDVVGDIRASTNLFASNNIYAAYKFVFGTSTSEGEYIERHGGSDLAFYGNGGHRFTVKGSGDCKIEDAGKGLILATPDGNNTYRVSVDNSGNLVTTQL